LPGRNWVLTVFEGFLP